jgi:hypothetical protein
MLMMMEHDWVSDVRCEILNTVRELCDETKMGKSDLNLCVDFELEGDGVPGDLLGHGENLFGREG